MLSVVVIGRNDGHGYNLNKRVATSLNNIAYCLTQEDEIIFVDWNTSKEYPTLPVAISDDLNIKTQELLKIVRVSEEIHKKVAKDSTRKVIEPVARNVGIRRTNYQNKWVLSTNTDMIFLLDEGGLNKLVQDLDDDLWLAFRNEIPEYIWETLDKRDPASTILRIKEINEKYDFGNKITISPRGSSGPCLTDGVGDFQLALRDDWFRIGGFCESMLYGWHVDTRASLKFRTDLSRKVSIFQDEQLVAFHQNHSRTPTGYHGTEKINDSHEALRGYQNGPDWGLRNSLISDLHFHNSNEFNYDRLLIKRQSQKSPIIPLEAIHLGVEYVPSRVANFLRDVLIVLPSESKVFTSVNNDLAQLINLDCEVLDLNFNLIKESWENGMQNADCVIVDLGVPQGTEFPESATKKALQNLLDIRKFYRFSMKSDTTFVFVRAQNWATRRLVRLYFNTQLFNNYSAILYGRKKNLTRIGPRIRIATYLLLYFAAQDYKSEKTRSKLIRNLKVLMPIEFKTKITSLFLGVLGN